MRQTILVTACLALLGGAGAALGASQLTSVYTEISEASCSLIPASGEPGDEEDGLRCKGPSGYELLALSGDLRATITLVSEGTEQELKFWDVITGSFSTLGPRAEWRVDAEGHPRALIVRVLAQEDIEHPDRVTSYLAVAKVTPEVACVTDRIAAGADDNERARAAADTATERPCLSGLQP